MAIGTESDCTFDACEFSIKSNYYYYVLNWLMLIDNMGVANG